MKEEGASLTLAELAEPKFLPVSVTASPVEIELPNGGLVRLPVGVGQAVIVDVIQAVQVCNARQEATAMTDLSELRIFVCTSPIKMNFSFDSLMGLAQAIFDQDPVVRPLVLVLQSEAGPDQDSVLGRRRFLHLVQAAGGWRFPIARGD